MPAPDAGKASAGDAKHTVWIFPIADGVLPSAPELMPNAVREYRNGVHEGVDLYNKADGNRVACKEPVINARDGWIVRADHKWEGMPLRIYNLTLAGLKQQRDEKALDRLRGRQVWVRTDDGAVVRYCHLSSIEPNIQLGLKIPAGTKIGAVGNSGTEDGAKGTSLNCHLHFEVWPTADAWLGKGLSPLKARGKYAELFGSK
jgi:murein DD-endopeptidase MepM/ murein hydrolase activator NlpD